MEGFCVKCKHVHPIERAERVQLKNGRAAVRGVCPHCGAKMFKFVGKAESGAK